MAIFEDVVASVHRGLGGGWQPIGTVPKPEGEYGRNPAVLVYVPAIEEPDKRVIVARYWGAWDEHIEPTHWMPLPQPPGSVEAAVGGDDEVARQRLNCFNTVSWPTHRSSAS